MSTFVVRKRIALGFLGEGWQDAFVVFSPFSFGDNEKLTKLRSIAQNQATMDEKEANKATEEIMTILKDKFVEGEGWNGEKLVPITKDNLIDLPMEIIVHILQTIQGTGSLVPKE